MTIDQARRSWTPLPIRACGITALLVLVSASVVGCAPSEDGGRAEIDRICVELIDDLSAMEATPSAARLADAAGQAGFELGSAAFDVERVATEGPTTELATALRALGSAYRNLGRQLSGREYASLAQTRIAAEAALSDALSAATSVGASDCAGIGLRVEYFAMAAAGAEAAAARIAPTGDYVTDADAACARYAGDTQEVWWKLGLRSSGGGGVDATPDAGDYIEAIEDVAVIEVALDNLIRELDVLDPPADKEADHTRLIEGYRAALAGLRSLGDGVGIDAVIASAEQADTAAERLGVACGL